MIRWNFGTASTCEFPMKLSESSLAHSPNVVDLSEQSATIGMTLPTYFVSQIIQYFATGLPPTSNYPRHARAYLDYCLANGYGVDDWSFENYTVGRKPNRITPVRKFLRFYQDLGTPRIMADPPRPKIPPAMNELILLFLREATHLRGDRSKETYAKALNAFFGYLEKRRNAGEPLGLGGQAVGEWVGHLRAAEYSAFTINLYLSAVKQLARWAIRSRERLKLDADQLNGLRDVADVRGLVIARTFYKDSLEAPERDQLLDIMDDPRERAIVALLVLEGLRTVEVTRLKQGDVHFSRRLLSVRGKGKDTKEDIKLFAACADHLRDYLMSVEAWPLTAEGRKEKLFPKLETYQIRYIVDKYLRRLGLKRAGMSAHSLRHTTGQLLLEAEVDLPHVQQHLRHATLETTQFYTKKRTSRQYFEQLPD